jgi:chemotaxis methyl-accepting protein methylase
MINLSPSEEDTLYKIIEGITGTCQTGSFKKDVLAANVERRIAGLGLKSFTEYLVSISEDDKEFDYFVGLVTIHTTYWFRENPHYQIIEEDVIKRINSSEGHVKFVFWSSACSTGQETYSLSFVLEKISQLYPRFSYEIFSSDIDTLCLQKAELGRYPIQELKTIPDAYHRFVHIHKDFFSIKDPIKRKIKFFKASLTEDLSSKFHHSIDYIFCRNVLIYFDGKTTFEIIKRFENYLSKNALLVLGHSESFDTLKAKFNLERNSCYRYQHREFREIHNQDDSILKTFSNPQIIALGASTGGPETLEKFLKNFPKPCPPIIVVQHINSRFCESFARRLEAVSGLQLRDTGKKTLLLPDSLYLSWGDYHLSVVEEKGLYYVAPNNEPLRNGHRASVDVLFESVARSRARSIGVLLTGMGKDGAEGLLKMKHTKKCLTMAQNKESSVVYGMPREAVDLGAVHIVGSDRYLSQLVRDYVQKKLGLLKTG